MKKVEASLAIQVLPKTQADDEALRIIDKVITYISSYSLKTIVSPFETTIEGDLDILVDIVKECQKMCIREGARGVMNFIKISYNPEGILTIDEKLEKYRL